MIGHRRVLAVMYRHTMTYRQAPVLLVETFLSAALLMLVWGFTAKYVSSRMSSSPQEGAALGLALVAGFLLWETTLRSQGVISNAFLEEKWSNNLTHMLASPLRPVELVMGLVGVALLRTGVSVTTAGILAWLVYGYNLLSLGPALAILVVNLLIMGWWLAVAVLAIIFRFGAATQGLASSFAIALTPLAAIFYPIEVLPAALRWIAYSLPAGHVFEVMRGLTNNGGILWSHVRWAFALNVFWLALTSIAMSRQLHRARRKGTLASA